MNRRTANRTFRAALSITLRSADTSFISGFVLHHAKALGSPAMVWAVLLLWLADKGNLHLDRHGRRLLIQAIANLEINEKKILTQQLEAFLQ